MTRAVRVCAYFIRYYVLLIAIYTYTNIHTCTQLREMTVRRKIVGNLVVGRLYLLDKNTFAIPSTVFFCLYVPANISMYTTPRHRFNDNMSLLKSRICNKVHQIHILKFVLLVKLSFENFWHFKIELSWLYKWHIAYLLYYMMI